MGTRSFPFGTGATLGYNTRSEMFLAAVPYGPFRFLYGIWLGRSHSVETWGTVPDGTQKNDLFQLFGTEVEVPSLKLGALTILRRYHGSNAVPFSNNVDDNALYNRTLRVTSVSQWLTHGGPSTRLWLYTRMQSGSFNDSIDGVHVVYLILHVPRGVCRM
jgi:hypothetical protein